MSDQTFYNFRALKSVLYCVDINLYGMAMKENAFCIF